ncbi:MAG TPA: TCR/Tet family MFS transporter [Caulobacteraceae bacterium]|jgi:DHA1 family tetracycline resistance protein-like MFS transporter|nr:TCR/Tet family MFS transporter [Caulobacteraceae bacterium]
MAASEESGTLPPKRAGRQALAFIFITVLLDMLALGMVAPVLPNLVKGFLHGNTSSTAVIYGLFLTVFALMQFFFSPMIGSLSDRFGRRPLILASNLGLGLNYVLMAWAPNLAWLFVGRVVSGVTGASFGTASAYIADTTPPEERAHAFGMLGAAFGVGFVLGPAIGGYLGEFDPKLPFWVAAGFSLANAAYGLFVLPESLSKACRRGFSWKNANPIGALSLLRRHLELLGLAGVVFLSNLAQVSLGSIVVLYATHRYGWSTGKVGATMAVVGVALIVVQVGVVGRAVRRFGARASLICGLCFGAAGLYIAGFARTGEMFWLGIPVLALWGISGAAAQGIITRHVSSSEQGQLQGATASLVAIAEVIGPSIFTLTFAYFVRPGMPAGLAGAPFLLAATILAAAAVLAFVVTRGERDYQPPTE